MRALVVGAALAVSTTAALGQTLPEGIEPLSVAPGREATEIAQEGRAADRIRRTLEGRLTRAGATLTFVPGTGLGGWPAAKEYARMGLRAAVLPAAELDVGDRNEFAIRRLPESLAVTDYLVRPKSGLSAGQEAVFTVVLRAAGEQVRESRGRWEQVGASKSPARG